MHLISEGVEALLCWLMVSSVEVVAEVRKPFGEVAAVGEKGIQKIPYPSNRQSQFVVAWQAAVVEKHDQEEGKVDKARHSDKTKVNRSRPPSTDTPSQSPGCQCGVR